MKSIRQRSWTETLPSFWESVSVVGSLLHCPISNIILLGWFFWARFANVCSYNFPTFFPRPDVQSFLSGVHSKMPHVWPSIFLFQHLQIILSSTHPSSHLVLRIVIKPRVKNMYVTSHFLNTKRRAAEEHVMFCQRKWKLRSMDQRSKRSGGPC